MKDATTELPPGLVVKRLSLDSASGPLDWWRVEDVNGAILGSGFDRAEAVRNAQEELRRRAG